MLQDAYGRYYTLGRIFVELIGRPKLMRYATARGMHHPQLMKFALKLLANLSDPTARRRERPHHQRHDPTRTGLQVTRCLG